MSITIKTYVSINEKPRLSPEKSFKTKKGVLYPDHLEIKVIKLSDYVDADGEIHDVEDIFIVNVNGSAKAESMVSPEVRELGTLLRAYDYSKFPLQLECSLFDFGRQYAKDVQKMITDYDVKEATANISAADLLVKLKSAELSETEPPAVAETESPEIVPPVVTETETSEPKPKRGAGRSQTSKS